MSNAVLRIITAVLGLPVVLAAAYFDNWSFGLLIFIAGLLIADEFYSLIRKAGLYPWKNGGFILAGCILLSPLVPGFLFVAAVVAIILIGSIPFLNESRAFPTVASTLIGGLYPVAFLVSLLAIRVQHTLVAPNIEAFLLILLILLIVWATDIFAYYGGVSFGRRKLIPSVSPNKTWEGAFCGLTAAILTAIVFKAIGFDALSWVDVAVLGLLGGSVSQVGDLVVSRLKRVAGADDSGSMLPGHGGLLDRVDGLILFAPVAYLYLMFLSNIWA